jgi:hypothetical protein
MQERPVAGDLEDAAASLDQLDLGVGVFSPDRVGQTGRPGFVVSHPAVFDGHLHRGPSG